MTKLTTCSILYVGGMMSITFSSTKCQKNYSETVHLGIIFRSYVVSHLRAILTLILTGNHYHANIILRKVIEDVLYLVCLDFLSRFGKSGELKIDVFKYYLFDPRQRVKVLRQFKLPEKDFKDRLNELYKLNKIGNEEKEEFIERFFHDGNELDFILLLSRIVCNDCLKGKNYPYMPIDENVIELMGPAFKHPSFEFGFKCELCEKKYKEVNLGVLPLIPDIETLYFILKKYVSDETKNALSNLRKTYKILSENFVHPSITIDFTSNEFVVEINNQKINLMGFDGLKYVLKNISFLLCDYYITLFNRYNFQRCSSIWSRNICKVRSKKFEKFTL